MTHAELERLCIGAYIAKQRTLTISFPTGSKFPAGWPRGELLSVNAAGVRNYAVNPLKVLAWLQQGWPA